MWKEYFPLLQVMPSGLSCSIQLDKIEQYAAAYCEKRGNYLSLKYPTVLFQATPEMEEVQVIQTEVPSQKWRLS
jgi:hypothetical protein